MQYPVYACAFVYFKFKMHARLLSAKFYQFMRILSVKSAAIATFMELNIFDIRNRQDLYNYCFGFALNWGDFDSAKLTIKTSMA